MPEVADGAVSGGHRSVHKIDVDPEEFPHLLQQYYARLFPYGRYFKWLSYGGADKKVFQNREFSFTLKDDVYIRYQSFKDQAEMTAAIQKRNPYKIDIGAVFTARPKDHKKVKASEFQPVEKELVFDIDMTDYDEIRTCCSGAAICPKCWPFMNVAIRVVDTALREDFGFENLLWVYSGRRGVHCWVADKRARALSQDARSAVAEYLNVIKGGDHQARRVNLPRPMHPSLERALQICQPYFKRMVLSPAGQDILRDTESQKQLVSVIGDETIERTLLESWAGDSETTPARWLELEDVLDKACKKQSKNKDLPRRKNEIVMQYTYPRLDIAVSKGLNHLLKSPFVVHPKTGRVCVPIDLDNIDSFDPFSVPTIGELCAQIDDYDMTQAAGASTVMDTSAEKEEEGDGEGQGETTEEPFKKVQDFKKTSLVASIEVFDKFLKGLAAENRAARLSAKAAGEMDVDNW